MRRSRNRTGLVSSAGAEFHVMGLPSLEAMGRDRVGKVAMLYRYLKGCMETLAVYLNVLLVTC